MPSSPPVSTVSNFAEASDPGCYTPLAPGWSIACADVIGSTRLAGEGRHRDVNFVAGAAVAVLSTALSEMGTQPCCQFGGDGAIAAVPPGGEARVGEVLAALAWWSIYEMDVPIRVGLVAVDELLAGGHEVRVAVQDFGGGNSFGLFMGSGVSLAEDWVKGDPDRQIAPHQGPLPGLEGLSCRWTPVAPSRGVVVCVIIDPLPRGEAATDLLRRLQMDIEAVVNTEEAAPLSRYGERLVPRWPPTLRSLWLETRTVTAGLPRWGRALRALVASTLMKLIDLSGKKRLGFDPAAYRRALAERSDYRKAAGGPRLVLDVTESEAEALVTLLERYVAMGEIHYGLARSKATTITCYVGDFAADRHVHFVDGAELGFWRASVALKGRWGKVGKNTASAA